MSSRDDGPMNSGRGPAFEADQRLEELGAAFAAAGIEAILLRAPDAFGRPDRCLPSITRHQADVLIRPRAVDRARSILEAYPWRFELGGRGAWRLIPRVSYLWDDLVGVDLLWAVQGSPFALRRERALERRLWARATADERGFLFGHPDDVAIYGAVQASRPGRPQRFEGEDLSSFLDEGGADEVLAAARDIGLEAAVARGFRIAGIGGGRVPMDLTERAANLAWRSLRPRRLRGLVVTGTPRLGRTITRARFAGREFLAGYGVFLPRPISESLVSGVLEAIHGAARPIVIDVGTGCGAVALAIAAAAPDARIVGVDTSFRAISWARINRPLSMVRRVRFRRGSLLAGVPRDFHGRVTAITANVPYVPPSLWGTGWTSRQGTVVGAGEDGLDLYRTLVRQARGFLAPGGRLVFQLARMQWEPFRQELEELGYRPGREISGMPGDVVVWATWTDGHDAPGGSVGGTG